MKKLILGVLALLAYPVLQADELKPPAWVVLPALGSSPETGFQYGAYVVHIQEQSLVDVPQNRYEALAQGTTEGQFQAYLWPNMYLDNGRLNVKASIGGQYWPSNYYGEGNHTGDDSENYSDTAFESSVSISREVWSNISLGISTFAEYHRIEINDDNPTLLTSNIAGIDGGLYSGAGFFANYDTRNNTDWPSSGALVSARADIFTSYLGSDLEFNILSLKAATYLPVGNHILAIGGQAISASDDTPFTHLPRPGGERSLRGANGNRWIDQNALGLQTEYRVPIKSSWAAVGFVDTFQVADDFEELAIDDFHYSVGLGIRYATTKDRFNLRLDTGWVDAETFNIAITVGEAF